LVPASIYVVGKRQTALGLFVALILLAAGVGLYLMPEKKATPERE
jgi:hypothetical protein